MIDGEYRSLQLKLTKGHLVIIFKFHSTNLFSEFSSPDAILVRSAKMHEMEFSPDLKAIGRAGAGVNNIPLDRCTEQGIVVFNTPGANANAVKELAIASMLLSSRNLVEGINWSKTLIGQGAEVPKLVEKGKSNFVGPELQGKTLGVIGLGAAYSAAALVQVFLLWAPLRKKLGALDEGRILKSTLILLVAGLVGAAATQSLKLLVVEFVELDTFVNIFGQGLIAGLGGLAAYGIMAYLFRSPEMMEFLRGMKRRLFRRAKTEETIVTDIQ